MNRMIQWQYPILALAPLILYYVFSLRGDFQLFMPTLFVALLVCALLLIVNLDWNNSRERNLWFTSIFLCTFLYLLLISKVTDNYTYISFFYIHAIALGLFLYPIRKTVFFVPGILMSVFGPVIIWGMMEVLKETKISHHMMDHFLVKGYSSLAISLPIIVFTNLVLIILILVNLIARRKTT